MQQAILTKRPLSKLIKYKKTRLANRASSLIGGLEQGIQKET